MGPFNSEAIDGPTLYPDQGYSALQKRAHQWHNDSAEPPRAAYPDSIFMNDFVLAAPERAPDKYGNPPRHPRRCDDTHKTGQLVKLGPQQYGVEKHDERQ